MSEYEKENNLYELHVFVCTNKKPEGRQCCADKGAAKLRDDLKMWALKRYGRRVRVNASGCLGECTRGISCVIYPQGEWHLNLTSDSLKALQEAIISKLEPTNAQLSDF